MDFCCCCCCKPIFQAENGTSFLLFCVRNIYVSCFFLKLNFVIGKVEEIAVEGNDGDKRLDKKILFATEVFKRKQNK
jgi:hypothetical protein